MHWMLVTHFQEAAEMSLSTGDNHTGSLLSLITRSINSNSLSRLEINVQFFLV